MHIQNLFLIGPMGAGKTTVGKQLAEFFHMDFVDSDHEIQRRTGVDIPTIFEYEGEEGFRQRESAVIDELTSREGLVLATGGGVIMREQNRRQLSARGVVVYLHCSVHQQFERTHRDKNRPLLSTPDPMKTLTELMTVRDPLYRETADIIVSTEGRNTPSIVQDIRRMLENMSL